MFVCVSQGKDLLPLHLTSSSIIYRVRNHSKLDDPVLSDTGGIRNGKNRVIKMGYSAGGSLCVCVRCVCVDLNASNLIIL